MRLSVVEHEADPAGLECMFCDDEESRSNYTVVLLEERGVICSLCPEHLDRLVTSALERHKKGIREGDPFWYLTPEVDPWAEYETEMAK